jgi:hypothetical protein
MLTPRAVRDKVELLRAENSGRDQRYADILKIRGGRAQDVYPDLFPEAWPRPIVANFCDIAARDLSELIAPLPAFNCSSASMLSDTAKKFADKRTKIVHAYIQQSKLGMAMYQGADWYVTYGLMPVVVEPDFKAKMPRLRIEDPYGSYTEFDRFNNIVSYTKINLKQANVLAAEYPELADKILRRDDPFAPANSGNTLLEVVHYQDADQFLIYVPQRKDLVLMQMPNLLGEVCVRVARRPSLDGEARGQFDDVLWIQLAKMRMAVLGLEAAEKSIQAPIALPQDVQEMSFGPDAVLRSQTPEKIRRVGIEMSPAAMQEESVLENELRVGGRYPEARSGVQEASIITGRGVQELLGGFDTQIKAAQEVLRDTFREAVALALKMDEAFWPDVSKELRGEVQGAPFSITYTPRKDIKGDHTCDVTYGLAAGMDPSRWLVFMLQLRGDRLVPREFVQRNLPMDVNVAQLMQQIDVEETRDAVKQAMFGIAEATPQFAIQGMSPAQIMQPFVSLIDKLQKGEAFEKAVLEAWKPPEQEQQAPPGTENELGGGPGTPAPPQGQDAQSAVGQAGMGPGGRPDLQYLLAGLQGGTGKPTLNASIARRIPATS